MIELLSQVNHWYWIAFGLLLLCGELLGTAGYFLWLGISAILVGMVLAVLPISWQLQWISFASFSLITTWGWWRFQHKKDMVAESNNVLNQRDKQLLGKVIRLDQDILAGNCRVRVGDTTWSARASQDIASGTLVKIIATDGIVVTIEPVES